MTTSGRAYLTPLEVEKLMKAAAGQGRKGHRDSTMILLAYRHGLRSSELVGLKRDQVDLDAGHLHVRRLKDGSPSTHPLGGVEIRALRRLFRESPASPYVFVSERKGAMTRSGFQKIVERAGEAAGLGFRAHPHQLRHATGHKLANEGVDTRSIQYYLGHKNIQNTVRYTAMSPARFKDFWKD